MLDIESKSEKSCSWLLYIFARCGFCIISVLERCVCIHGLSLFILLIWPLFAS